MHGFYDVDCRVMQYFVISASQFAEFRFGYLLVSPPIPFPSLLSNFTLSVHCGIHSSNKLVALLYFRDSVPELVLLSWLFINVNVL